MKRSEDSEFSSLKTVSSFDRGDSCTVEVDVNSTDVQHFSPSSLLVESLIEQLCKLVEKDPHNQKRIYLIVCEKLHQMNLIDESYEREEFQFMRSHYQKALYQLLAIAKTTSIENNSVFQRKSDPTCDNVLEWSRYCTEFRELEYIARGGFGYVYKAQHKLDGGFYAVKKILLKYQSVNDFLQNLKEVKMLAKFNHPNIVSYKAAWLEPFKEKKRTKNFNAPAILSTENNALSESYEIDDEEDGSLEVVFENTNSNISVHNEHKSIVNTSDSDSSGKIIPVDNVMIQNKAYHFSYRMDNYTLRSPMQNATLYIQMQLCEKTMRQWLDFRNQEEKDRKIDIKQCVDIFKKVVKGVEYIHSQGIVHHDIKPSNIFVSEDLNEVQVGDFGLACCLLTHQTNSLSVISTHPRGQIGTKLYAAPEQLRGTCHPKSDVYSLGIVLLELLQPFTTSMERTKVIEQLRSGHIPTQLAVNHPHLAKVISETVTKLNERPSSGELLERLEEMQDADSVKLIAEQKKIIKQLRGESLAKDREIEFLKKKIEELMAK